MHALRGVALLAACAWIAPAGAPLRATNTPSLARLPVGDEALGMIRKLGLRATETSP